MFDPFYPFDWLATQIVTQLLGLSISSHLGSSLHFFLYDVPKVLTLLIVISFIVGTFQSFLEPERVRSLLEGKRTFAGNILAAMVGIVTPFCSCSAVPLFIGFLEAGVPLGVTFSYLMAAPMVNEVAVILLWGLFGLNVTLIYIGFGVGLAIASGYIIGLLKLEKWVEPFVWELQKSRQAIPLEGEDNLETVALTWDKDLSKEDSNPAKLCDRCGSMWWVELRSVQGFMVMCRQILLPNMQVQIILLQCRSQ
ncbi:permease [Calothrix sp. 336/3]|uniref:permease n=1 Tax=Calothrix sp. 336/3 TaxID=1337936 RepID=UPI000AD60AFB|nr:permease [Calothrix sp. 336/3]